MCWSIPVSPTALWWSSLHKHLVLIEIEFPPQGMHGLLPVSLLNVRSLHSIWKEIIEIISFCNEEFMLSKIKAQTDIRH